MRRASGRRGGRLGGRMAPHMRSLENISCSSEHGQPCAKARVGLGKSRSADDVMTRWDRYSHKDTERDRGHEGQWLPQTWEGRLRGSSRAASLERTPSVERVAPPRPLGEAEREEVMRRMQEEFRGRRKAVLSGLPTCCREEDVDEFLQAYSCRAVSKVKDGTVRILFPDPDTAKEQVHRLTAAHYSRSKLTASFGHPNSLLFVGNLSPSHTMQEIHTLFQPHGTILRCFIVCSPHTGLSKGYGFVEFTTREEAAQAKLHLATRVLGQRSLRVDFADNGMQTCLDLHSQTLFVDRLPKGFSNDETLRENFSAFGVVNFCQIALAPNGSSRGFAFVDMSTWQEAEQAQSGCNGAYLAGHDIRVSFGMPCRPGACILQHKTSITIPISVSMRLPAQALSQKENFPLTSKLPHSSSSSLLSSLPSTLQTSYSPSSALLPHTLPPLSSLPFFSSSSSQSLSSPPPPPPPPPTLPPSPDHWHGTITEPHNTSCSIHQTQSRSRKRCAPDSDLDSLEHHDPHQTQGSSHSHSVYDRPYIGQHQQGIPFTHPLKRIKMDKR